MVDPNSFVLVTYQPYREPRKDEKFHKPSKIVHHHIMSEVALLALAGNALVHGATRVKPKTLALVK